MDLGAPLGSDSPKVPSPGLVNPVFLLLLFLSLGALTFLTLSWLFPDFPTDLANTSFQPHLLAIRTQKTEADHSTGPRPTNPAQADLEQQIPLHTQIGVYLTVQSRIDCLFRSRLHLPPARPPHLTRSPVQLAESAYCVPRFDRTRGGPGFLQSPDCTASSRSSIGAIGIF